MHSISSVAAGTLVVLLFAACTQADDQLAAYVPFPYGVRHGGRLYYHHDLIAIYKRRDTGYLPSFELFGQRLGSDYRTQPASLRDLVLPMRAAAVPKFYPDRWKIHDGYLWCASTMEGRGNTNHCLERLPVRSFGQFDMVGQVTRKPRSVAGYFMNQLRDPVLEALTKPLVKPHLDSVNPVMTDWGEAQGCDMRVSGNIQPLKELFEYYTLQERWGPIHWDIVPRDRTTCLLYVSVAGVVQVWEYHCQLASTRELGEGTKSYSYEGVWNRRLVFELDLGPEPFHVFPLDGKEFYVTRSGKLFVVDPPEAPTDNSKLIQGVARTLRQGSDDPILALIDDPENQRTWAFTAKSFFALAEPVEPRPFAMPQPQGEEPWRTLDLLIDCAKAITSN